MRCLAILSLLAGAGCFTKPERIDGAPRDGATDGRGNGADAPDACSTGCPGICAADGFCVIQDSGSGEPLQCPPGLKCRVLCTDGDCKGGVDCGMATECDVHCVGNDTCKDGQIDCGSASICTVECEGKNTCQGSASPAVNCGASTCTVECDGDGACQEGISSSGGSCTAACCGDSSTCADGVGSCTPTGTCD